ncbi:fumarylacetoacetate hydrolase family protein [Arthrobacter sp. ISL-5]|uniref:fumarylacetoacetate hydrolase family protein n=1 Tax=Arthrobacter sp. ISL-5 TaxID=2819111 RepID=UPI001BED23F6|nr:fumarylacetoacetate hydrolase family protein [Arthrobacter sp. ISL-5]MBT2551723.1 fumarylacetoacetate hydrolase family protein [Arthrobacter sp. ISL-5]
MRLANISSRLTLVTPDGELVDVSEATGGRFSPQIQECYERPIGPFLVTPDEFEDPNSIELGCAINGEEVQKGNTSDMVFSVPEIIARLSSVTPLLPGDVIFTGAPPGVGVGRVPQRFLAPGDELVTYARGVGEMHHRLQKAPN